MNRRRAGMLALALTLALPSACHDPPRPAEPAQEISMDDSLRQLDQHPRLAVSIRQGTEHFRDGVVTVTIRGDGLVVVDRLRAGTPSRVEQRLPPERVRDLGRALAEHRVTAARTSKLPREPGDTPLVLRVDGGARPFQAEVWYGDRYQDRDLDALIRLADALVTEVAPPAR